MAKRRNTVSKKNAQNANQQKLKRQQSEYSSSHSDDQQQEREQRSPQRRRTRRNSDIPSNNLSNYVALIAISLVIGSVGYYFQSANSAIAPARQPRAPSLARRTIPMVGDSCNPKKVNSVCLFDNGDGYAFCNSRGYLERAGNAPTGQMCTDIDWYGRKGVSFVATGTVKSDAGTKTAGIICDPRSVDSLCLTQDTYAKCGSDHQVIKMGSTAPGTSCSYAFTNGVARVIQVFATPVNLRNYAMNSLLWMMTSQTRDGVLSATMEVGAYCWGPTTVCTSSISALKCHQRQWVNVTCSSCIQQDSSTAFVSDTCE